MDEGEDGTTHHFEELVINVVRVNKSIHRHQSEKGSPTTHHLEELFSDVVRVARVFDREPKLVP